MDSVISWDERMLVGECWLSLMDRWWFSIVSFQFS